MSSTGSPQGVAGLGSGERSPSGWAAWTPFFEGLEVLFQFSLLRRCGDSPSGWAVWTPYRHVERLGRRAGGTGGGTCAQTG